MHIHKLLSTTLCAATILCAQAQKTFKNPVFNQDTPDPTVVRDPDGTFYAYGTGGTCRKSTDLATWTNVGNALSRPTWNDTTYVDENGQKKTDYYSLWALDVSKTIDDNYLVYYACALWGNGTRTGIGVATGTSPTKFTDHGRLFRSTEIGVTNSIDPCYVEEFDKKYLVWGSFHDLYISELTEDGLAIKDFTKKTKLAGGAFEGVMIYKHGSYYYLFASVGSCCEGVNSTYRTVVGRSTNLLGPYTNKQGGTMVNNYYTTIIQGNSSWKGPGHNSEIITDDAGQDWLLYHAYSATTPDNGRVLMLDKITWGVDEWPTVGDGTPSTTEQEAPIFYEGNGANVTYKFKNTDLSKSEWQGWEVNNMGTSDVTSGKGSAFIPFASAQEGAHFDASQSVSKLKNGIYELKFNGFSTAGSSECYLNGLSTPLYNPLEEGKTPATSEKLLSNQLLRDYYAQSAYGIVSDGKLTIGVRTRNPLLSGERFCMANVRVIYREKDSQAQEIVWQNIKKNADEYSNGEQTFFRGYTSRVNDYQAQAEATEDSVTRYDYLLKGYLTLDSIQSSIQLYDSLKTAVAGMQLKVDAAKAQEYASEEAIRTLTEAKDALSGESYDNSQMEDLLSRMELALHNMEYSYQQGDGTKENPYVILRPAQLDYMHDVLIKDEMVYFVLGSDIDMSGYNWKQLNSADNNYKYRISLDGQGHIISNLTPDGTKHNPSFFGVLCGECRNVGFLNAHVESSTSAGAILCGYMGHSTYKDSEGNLLPVVVENCYFEGSVSGKGYIGAIGGTVNYSPVTIRNCYCNVQIIGTCTMGNYGGGIAGRIRTDVHVERSYTAGDVSAYTAGGIIGGGQNSTTPACLYENVMAWTSNVDGTTAHPLGSMTEADVLQGVLFSANMKTNNENVEGGKTDDELRQNAASWGSPWHSDPTAGNGYPILEWQYQRGDYRQKCGFPISDGVISTPSSEQQMRQEAYDLQGRRILSPTKGLYIINGRKVLVK
ncbi:MAG: family 43 glycosylhydrolase [Bacteroidaceae bacterium]